MQEDFESQVMYVKAVALGAKDMKGEVVFHLSRNTPPENVQKLQDVARQILGYNRPIKLLSER